MIYSLTIRLLIVDCQTRNFLHVLFVSSISNLVSKQQQLLLLLQKPGRQRRASAG